MEVLPEKNTFIHFGEPDSLALPPVNSAPGTMLDRSFRMKAGTLEEAAAADSSRSFVSSVKSSVASLPSAGPGDQVVVAHAALDRASVQGPASLAAEGAVQLSHVVTCQRAGMPSLGSEGHCTGQCIPCLMQVRWQAGKCAEPCKFGALCGRCHEPHTEEELQKIQAKMRKQKRRHGERAVALLSSAFARGNVAPVGAGAAAARRA